MMNEIATQLTWLWPLAWQSAICLAAGIGTSILLRRRATRAHQVLLFAIVAAVAVPAFARVAKRNQWGLFVAERTVLSRTSAFLPPRTDFAAVETITGNDTADESARVLEPAGAVASPTGPRTPRQIVLPLWFAISVILLLRLAGRFILGLRLVQRSEPVHCAAIEDALRCARGKLEIRGQVIIHQSSDVRSPVIWCWARRAILLIPENAHQDESLDWKSIVCHELAHWKRRDHVSGLLTELIVCLLPWQPLLWWGGKRLRDLSEQSCDDWVLASGQTGTRYARTLLGLIPQGYDALVPAVVAGRSGLGARVRRILADQCADPRSSPRWTLAAVVVAACLSLGMALAQTRPAPSEKGSETALGHGATIVELPFAHSIQGRILDPNGRPLGHQPVRVTVLPMTLYVVEPNAEGYFELPWSPDWTRDGRKARLLVRDNQKNLAVLSEIQDLSTSLIIRPEPALTVTGRVVDPNGRPIAKAMAMLSLADEFACSAPLAAAGTDDNGDFKIKAVPCRQMYTLSIRADGHVTGSAALNPTDASTQPVDVGAITLTPARPGASLETPHPHPDWKQDFQRIYHLAEGETLKLIKPPFSPARQDYVIDGLLSHGIATARENFRCVMEEAWYVCAGYRWNGQLEDGPMFAGRSLPRLQTVLNSILEIPDYDFRLSEEMQNTPLPKGDWIVRKGTSVEERLKALEQIIAAELHRPIHFEQRQTERDTIVVTGRYAFTPLPDSDPNRLLVFTENAGTASWPGEAHSLSELFDTLADGINVAIDNQSEAHAHTIRYTYVGSLLSWRGNVIDQEKDLPLLLDNLARQTGLQFKVERRTAPLWCVIEEDGQ